MALAWTDEAVEENNLVLSGDTPVDISKLHYFMNVSDWHNSTCGNILCEEHASGYSIDKFVETGVYWAHWRDRFPVFCADNDVVVGVYKGVVHKLDYHAVARHRYSNNKRKAATSVMEAFKECPMGVVLSYKVPGRPDTVRSHNGKQVAVKKVAVHVVCNADESDETADSKLDGYGNFLVNVFGTDHYAFPEVSFTCLARCLNYKTPTQAAQALATDAVVIVDFTPGEQRPAGAKKDPAPAPGFTRLYAGGPWHRPSTVLMKTTKEINKIKTDTYFLFGSDEQAYFGVELTGKPKHIEDAYVNLMPADAVGKRYTRQGEWFAIHQDTKFKPHPLTDRLLDIGQAFGDEMIHMPRKHEDSHKHFVIDTMEGYVTKDGKVFFNGGKMVHAAGDHADMQWEGWAQLAENTALRAFSVEGVD